MENAVEPTPNVYALKQVIRVLKEVETLKKRFDLHIFAYEYQKSEEGIPEVCNTVACAVGWCLYDPWHISQGLLKDVDDCTCEDEDGNLVYDVMPVYTSKDEDGDPETFESWSAINKFYGLTQAQSEHFFHAQSYKSKKGATEKATPRMVIERIQAFLDNLPDPVDPSLNKLR